MAGIWWIPVILQAAAAMASLSRGSTCSDFPEQGSPTASGYLIVNDTSGSRMFFAYYEAQQKSNSSAKISFMNNCDEIPIILWLQGGPGCSSMLGNFFELGPWLVDEDLCLNQNPVSWNRLFGLLFLDNPVGTGFSIAPSDEDIPVDQDAVARDVHTALIEFFDKFPELQGRPFYVAGESYGGKYVPSVASYILRKREDARSRKSRYIRTMLPQRNDPVLRIDGIAIGNGLTHPVAQIALNGPTAYYMGLLDENEADNSAAIASKVIALIEEEQWVAANDARNELLNYIQNVTGLATLLDVRRTVEYHKTKAGVDFVAKFLNQGNVQTKLNAEAVTFESCSSRVRKLMAADIPKSTKHNVEELLNASIPVLLYQGQFDLRDGVPSAESWIRLLNWSGLENFYSAGRTSWELNGTVVGHVQSYSLLTHVSVSNAGHLVPADQGYAAQTMIEKWISGEVIS